MNIRLDVLGVLIFLFGLSLGIGVGRLWQINESIKQADAFQAQLNQLGAIITGTH